MLHGCHSGSDFIKEQTRFDTRVRRGESFNSVWRNSFGGDHPPACIRKQKWTAELKPALLVKLQIMLNMFIDAILFAIIHAVFPFGTGPVEDHISHWPRGLNCHRVTFLFALGIVFDTLSGGNCGFPLSFKNRVKSRSPG